MYSIGEISEMFNLPIPTLRFYDKEGLLLDLKEIQLELENLMTKQLKH